MVKKRIGLAGRGKRGGARTLVATNKGNRWFFVFDFEKNERANVGDEELEGLQAIAAELLARTGKNPPLRWLLHLWATVVRMT